LNVIKNLKVLRRTAVIEIVGKEHIAEPETGLDMHKKCSNLSKWSPKR
jgi:hypothetical protein